MHLNHFWIWDIGITLTSFAFLFWKTKYVTDKKKLVQDLIQPPSLHIYMCSLYTYTNTHMPKFSKSGFFGLSMCLVPTPGLTSKYLMCSVCVYAIHTHTPIYAPTCIKNREDTDNTPISSSVKNNPLRQATSALHRLADTLHPRPPTLYEHTAHILVHVHALQWVWPQMVCANVYADVKTSV